MKFKKGDRVKVLIDTCLGGKLAGCKGVIKGMVTDDPGIGVELDVAADRLHSFNTYLPKGKKNHCWFFREDEIESCINEDRLKKLNEI
jgi:hypothetical protein